MKFNIILLIILLIPFTSAEIITTSNMGFHPESNKQVVIYTHETAGNFTIEKNGDKVYEGQLTKSTNYEGQEVQCQGNNPCLIGDFSDFKQNGIFKAKGLGLVSDEFEINKNIYSENIKIFNEFFEALKQQNSDYHEDLNTANDLTIIADGSFIMKADQAALTLIRLGSAYRRNPEVFNEEFVDHLKLYAEYLQKIQGVKVNEVNNGFRIYPNLKIHNAFVAGPTNITSIDIYLPNKNYLETVNVSSLCQKYNGSLYSECIDSAAQYYKCQFDEVCLNSTYIENTGELVNDQGYAVNAGWQYEFGCNQDIQLDNEYFVDEYNPCLIFEDETSGYYTVITLLAYLETYPAIKDYYSVYADELLDIAINTDEFIFEEYILNDEEKAFYGTAKFLLYDYTGKQNYLLEAYELKDEVSQTLISDSTRGNVYYWEEFIRHKKQLESAGYEYGSPQEVFRGKLFFDYKDRGPTSVGNNAERVFQFDNNILFQNSRFILTEGLIGVKTLDITPANEYFIKEIADNQIAWITGMNAVQDGVSLGSELKSYSFIFGIGNYPEQQHTRYFLNTGYSKGSNNEIVGSRSTSVGFLVDGKYYDFDGVSQIMGFKYGSPGNNYLNEEENRPFKQQEFLNGKNYIPGWINGAFDIKEDDDIIFNYEDNMYSYPFTESTNEIVATAVEYFSYLDAYYNHKSRHTKYINDYDGSATLIVHSNPQNAKLYVDEDFKGLTNLELSLSTGEYDVRLEKDNYTSYINKVLLLEEDILYLNVTLIINNLSLNDSYLNLTTIPNNSTVFLDSKILGITENGNLYERFPPGNKTLKITHDGYFDYSKTYEFKKGVVHNLSINLTQKNSSYADLLINTIPKEVNVFVNGEAKGITNQNGSLLLENLSYADYQLYFEKENYYSNYSLITINKSFVEFNITLFPQTNYSGNFTNQTNIIDSEINLELTENGYFMYETKKLELYVETDGEPPEIFLDGKLITKNYTFEFLPNILFTSNQKLLNLTAKTNSDSKTWMITVIDVINPFFVGDFGGEESTIHVFTNNNAVNYTTINVTITGSSTRVFSLTDYVGGNETDWRKSFIAQEGNNFLNKILAHNNLTNTTDVYELNHERAHYRTPQSSGGSSSGGSSASNSRASSGGNDGEPELVYAVFDKSLFNSGDFVTLTLDAKNFEGGVSKVIAIINGPNQTINQTLNLVNGSQEYGTWQSVFSVYSRGEYSLTNVILSSNQITNKINVRNIGFYVLGNQSNYTLELVNVLLNKNVVDNGSEVLLLVDARDSEGINEAIAIIKESENQITVPLELVRGNNYYGTWQGVFIAKRSDTTYQVEKIILSNKNEKRDLLVSDRQVYVNYIQPKTNNLITGRATGFQNLLTLRSDPWVPVVIGLGIAILVGIVIIGINLIKK